MGPMSQFSAVDGCMTDWHLMHLGHMAISGSGLVMTEAVYPEAVGRNGPGCVGLYSDACEESLTRVLGFCRKNSPASFGIQLGNAGRKASIQPPWHNRAPIPRDGGGWGSVAPSAISMGSPYPPPRALTVEDLNSLRDRFVEATRRAARIGYDLLEIHAAHGYLFHQFLSPWSNRREDRYGGSLENRARLVSELIDALRAECGNDFIIGLRLPGNDFIDGGIDAEESARLTRYFSKVSY